MIWFVYNLLFALAYLIVLPRFLFRMWRRGGYKQDFMHRFAVYSRETAEKLSKLNTPIWIHAVSVGEIQIAIRFMEEFRGIEKNASFVLTTTTSTGHKLAEKKIGQNDILLYFPIDFPPIVKRALDAIRPSLLLLTESEIWPNIIRMAGKRGIPIMLINGRISDSSYRGYRLLKPFFGRVFRLFDLLVVQTSADEGRLLDIGAEKSRVTVLGNAKFDVASVSLEAANKVRDILASLGFGGNDPILLGGSTWPGEEAILLDLFKRIRPDFPGLRLILIPRHAERREEVISAIESSGLSYSVRSSTDGKVNSSGGDVLLVATTGELIAFYASATVAFVGKSLTVHGGQNVIEPAMLGKPVVVGPHVENFAAVVADLAAAEAIVQVRNANELDAAVRRLLGSPEERATLAERAAEFVRSNQGVLTGTVRLVRERMGRDAVS